MVEEKRLILYEEMVALMATNTDLTLYREDVKIIKRAILESQGRALRLASGQELSLYFGIGLYISAHSREGYWGTGAIDAISEQLHKEMPGLRGFSSGNMRKMRIFAEFWSQYLNCSPSANEIQPSDTETLINTDSFSVQKWSPVANEIKRDDILSVSFTHHMEILLKTKDINEVLFYLRQTVMHQWNKYELRDALKQNIYKNGDNTIPNNFIETIPDTRLALKTVQMFKDEYILDYINAEDIDEEYDCVDERVVENQIVRNIRKFIMTFGKDFAFLGNQYHLEMYGVEHFPDLLFFNRELNALVVIELKIGDFKDAYLGQLFGYLKILDDKVKKPHENPSVGIVLCKEANKAYAQYAVQDYSKPMGVATYSTLAEMPEEMQQTLPDVEELKKLL